LGNDQKVTIFEDLTTFGDIWSKPEL